MTNPRDRYPLARRQQAPLNHRPTEPVTLASQQPQHLTVRQEHVATSTYTTERSRGRQPQQLPRISFANGVVQLCLAIVCLTLTLATVSMISIALNSYANSVDRVDSRRSFMEVQ